MFEEGVSLAEGTARRGPGVWCVLNRYNVETNRQGRCSWGRNSRSDHFMGHGTWWGSRSDTEKSRSLCRIASKGFNFSFSCVCMYTYVHICTWGIVPWWDGFSLDWNSPSRLPPASSVPLHPHRWDYKWAPSWLAFSMWVKVMSSCLQDKPLTVWTVSPGQLLLF